MGWRGRLIVTGIVAGVGIVAWAVLARALALTQNTALTHFDTIIVLGDQADADGNPTPTQLSRVTEAVHEYEQGVAPRIILSGGAAHNRFVEAQVMARSAEAQGIPASVLFEDQQAMNTIENACNSVRIMRAHGWQSAEVISNGYHLPRAGLIFSRLPIEWRVHPAPFLGPPSSGQPVFESLLETIKTVRYLVWTRQTEPCQL